VPLFLLFGEKFFYEILETDLLYGENPKFLSHTGSKRYRVVTDRQTDRQTELP